MQTRTNIAIAASVLLLSAVNAHAGNRLGADQGKLLLTAGFNDVEGAGGAGLVPIALITGYGTRDSWGANAHFTSVDLNSFQLHAYGVAIGALDRFELSYTKHKFDVTGGALDGLGVEQSIVAAKVKLFGNAVYQQDSWLPQVSVGAQYKQNDGIKDASAVGFAGLVSPTQLGAKDDNGTDFYLSATKIFLGQSFVVNATLRYTKANQFGLLGFGGDRESGYSLEPEEFSRISSLASSPVACEYRSKPQNLSVDKEDDAWDAFVAWTPTRNISLVAAYVNLGSILAPVTADTDDQKGAYLSLQVGF